MNFTTKETYLQEVAEWKANYKALSQEIRDARKVFVEAQRHFSKINFGNGYGQAWSALEKARDAKRRLSERAHAEIGYRFEMKQEAARQYLANKVEA